MSEAAQDVARIAERIRRDFEESADVKRRFAKDQAERVAEAAGRMIAAYRSGNKAIFFGNGGSACDASHLAAELVNRYKKDRAGLPALALAADPAVVTSISNDYHYEDLFARQVQALGQPGDIAIAISTSGNSPNVLKGVDAAREKGLFTIGFTGHGGGKLAARVDMAFVVPSRDTARIQETHITLGHLLCELVEEALFPDS